MIALDTSRSLRRRDVLSLLALQVVIAASTFGGLDSLDRRWIRVVGNGAGMFALLGGLVVLTSVLSGFIFGRWTETYRPGLLDTARRRSLSRTTVGIQFCAVTLAVLFMAASAGAVGFGIVGALIAAPAALAAFFATLSGLALGVRR